MIYFKIKLQWKIRKNKNYSYIFVNSPYRILITKYINLHLKLRKNKNYHEKKTAHWHMVTSIFLKQHLVQASNISWFSIRPFKCTNNIGSVFFNRLDHRIYKTKFLTHISPPLPPLVSQLNFSLPLILFVTAAMLSFSQSPVKHLYGESEFPSGSSLFLDVKLRRLVVSYGCFGTTYRSHVQGSSCQRNVGN
jgi:hypothetical protein